MDVPHLTGAPNSMTALLLRYTQTHTRTQENLI